MDSDLTGNDRRHGSRTAESESWGKLRRPLDVTAEVDPWSWLHRAEPVVAEPSLAGCHVLAVLVTMDAADWLPETLDGLARLSHRPTRLIAIDNASTDRTPALLKRAKDQGLLDAVYTGKRRFGFGRAVAAALAADQQPRHESDEKLDAEWSAQPADDPSRWLWLLHDDAVPDPDALRALLQHVVADPSIDITGPKLLLPRRPQAPPQLSEVGVSISGTGRRERMLDPGEVDQGQWDKPQHRLGVSTCGMLVKASVWEQLGGLDPGLPVFRDGVELGWRAHLLGHRVVTTPAARMTHRQVGHAGLRPGGAAGRRPAKVDRQLGMLVVIGHAPRPRVPLVWLRLVWSCLLRALGYLLGKAPGRARDEIIALASFVAHPGRISRLRDRTALTPVRGSDEVLRRLRPPWWASLRVAAEALSGAVSERYRSIAGDLEATSLDELTGDDFSSQAEETPKNPWLSPIVAVGVLLALGSLLASRSLFGLGHLTATALLPVADGLGALWQAAVAPIPGAPGQPSPPWLALVALGSTALLGQPEWLVTLVLCAVVPISLIAVYPVVRNFVVDRRVRLWMAVSYALLPVLLGGTNQGRLSLSVFAMLLPLLVLAVRGLVLRRPKTAEAWRGGWGAGVVLVVLVAFEPSMIIFALLLAVIGAWRLRRAPRKLGRVAIAVGVPLLVLSPWWPSLLAFPGRLVAGPDSAVSGAPPAPAVWSLLLGRESGPGLPPLWLGVLVFGVIWTAALLGLARRPRRVLVRTAIATAALALATAVVLSRLVVTVPPTGAEVRPWTGPYLLIAFGALVLAAGVGADGLFAAVRSHSFSWLQPTAVFAGVIAAAASLLAAGWWLWAGASGPIDRSQLTDLPPYVRAAMLSDAAVRVLAIDLDGNQAQYWVVADDGTRLGDADRGFTFGGSTIAPQQAEDLVLRLVAGTADFDVVPQLRELGVGFLWVSGATEEQQARIDNTPGLGAASGNTEATVWQLPPPASRMSLVDGESVTPMAGDPAPVPAGGIGRVARVGEAADPRWRASLADEGLVPVAAGWQQGFALPQGGGPLTRELRSPAGWLLIVQGVLLLVAAVLAAPGIRRADVRDPTRTARRAASVGSRVV